MRASSMLDCFGASLQGPRTDLDESAKSAAKLHGRKGFWQGPMLAVELDPKALVIAAKVADT